MFWIAIGGICGACEITAASVLLLLTDNAPRLSGATVPLLLLAGFVLGCVLASRWMQRTCHYLTFGALAMSVLCAFPIALMLACHFAMALSFMPLPLSAFLYVGQLLVGSCALVVLWRRSGPQKQPSLQTILDAAKLR